MTHPASANYFLKAGAVSEVIGKGDDMPGWTGVLCIAQDAKRLFLR